MKKLSLLALAAAGLLMVGCSEKDADENNTSQQGTEQFTDGAFIGVTLQLPSAKANVTRANEDFDDGVADEFEVKNAMLYIFKGSNEDDAEFVGQYVIGKGSDWEADGAPTTGKDNVTSTYTKATKISNELAEEMANTENTANYYAYVIVNNPGVDAVATGTTFGEFKTREWSLIGTPVAEQENTTEINKNGLLMTNAPVCEDQGGSIPAPVADDKYYTLVKLDKSKVYATASAAQTNPAGCIFIERAAVKITVSATATHVGDSEGPSITFNEWQIINYPSTFYNTRQIEPTWGNLISYITAVNTTTKNSDITTTDFANWNVNNQYRFVSNNAFNPQVPDAHTGPYRTYFAKDPTYTSNGGLNRTQAVTDKWIAMNKRGFTVENTFDVEHQIWQNTTMVTFKATIGSGDFYTVNGGDEIYTQTNALNEVQNGVANLPTVKSAINAAITKLITLSKTSATDETLYAYTITPTVTFKTTPTASANSVEMVVDYTVTGGNASSTKTKDDIKVLTEGTNLTTALNDALENYTISFYEGGVAYYNARIQHFGEYETPWSATKPFQTVAPGSTVQQIYGVDATPDLSANRFLGRYGVVRDNWYKLTVGAVNHIGTAEPVNVAGEGKNTPDDQIENYISVHVHIVPWVIRNQSISF